MKKKPKSFDIATLLLLASVSVELGEAEKIGMVAITADERVVVIDRNDITTSRPTAILAYLKTAIRVKTDAGDGYLIGLAKTNEAIQLKDEYYGAIAKLLDGALMDQLAGEYDNKIAEFTLAQIDQDVHVWTVVQKLDDVVDIAKVEVKGGAEEIWAGNTKGQLYILANDDFSLALANRVADDFSLSELKSIMRPYTEKDKTFVGLNTLAGDFLFFEIKRSKDGSVGLVAVEVEFDLPTGGEVYAKSGHEFVIKADDGNFYNKPFATTQAQAVAG